MAVKIETTVQNAAAELEKSGASAEQKVFLTIYDDEETAKLEALRADIAAGEASGGSLDGEEVFANLRAKLKRQDR